MGKSSKQKMLEVSIWSTCNSHSKLFLLSYVFFKNTGDAIVCIKVLKAPMFYMNHSRHYPCCVLQVTSPKVWDVQHPDIPQWTKGHEDLRMSNNIWLQDRIVPNRHIGTDSESSSRDDVKMDIVFVYAYYIHVYIHHIHISYIADRYIYIMYVCSCRCNHPGVYGIYPHRIVFSVSFLRILQSHMLFT